MTFGFTLHLINGNEVEGDTFESPSLDAAVMAVMLRLRPVSAAETETAAPKDLFVSIHREESEYVDIVPKTAVVHASIYPVD